MTINDHWGYCASDHNFKSPAVLLHNLVDIASKGGNYLLNVGPDATGTIPQPEVDALLSVGNWLKVNGKSIYGTTATPLAKLPANERMTVKGDRLYLHVFDWSPGVVLPGLATDVKSARILNRGAWLAVSKTPDGVSSIAAPAHPDLLDTVVELRLKGPLQVYEIPLGPQADGSIVLNADDADLHGRLMVEHEPSNIGYWIDRADSVNWSVRAPNGGGRYKVSVVYACDKGVGGSVVSLSAGKGSDVRLTVEDTGAWDSYRTVDLPGELFLPGGNTPITLSAVSMPHGAVMNLRKITLTPVPISANR